MTKLQLLQRIEDLCKQQYDALYKLRNQNAEDSMDVNEAEIRWRQAQIATLDWQKEMAK